MLFQTVLFPDSSVRLDFTSSSGRVDVSLQPWGAESCSGLLGHVPSSLGSARAGNSLGSCSSWGEWGDAFPKFSRPSRPLSTDGPQNSHPAFPSPSLPPPSSFSLLSSPGVILVGSWALPSWLGVFSLFPVQCLPCWEKMHHRFYLAFWKTDSF